MSKTKYTELPKVIRKIAEKMLVDHREKDPESYILDEAELMNCLARILEGKHPLKAFGSPGDWGYGTPIGDALMAAYDEPQPKETVTTSIETEREITQSELLSALKDSMDPLFALLNEKLLEEDGQSLQILVDVKAGKISLKYGVAKI